mmetsp:Transcript_13887/g.18948  ORF Transcript_13887/g.18948 Transcript_13887/m.18948 type:complete len:106 (+) Transcript_13887:218-535(+)
MGLCVKVTGIKSRNVRGDNDFISEGEEDEIVIEEGQTDELSEIAKSQDTEQQFYYMYDRPLSSMEVTTVSFENNPSVRNHIIVCGVPSSIKSFIMPLRAKYLAEY